MRKIEKVGKRGMGGEKTYVLGTVRFLEEANGFFAEKWQFLAKFLNISQVLLYKNAKNMYLRC